MPLCDDHATPLDRRCFLCEETYRARWPRRTLLWGFLAAPIAAGALTIAAVVATGAAAAALVPFALVLTMLPALAALSRADRAQFLTEHVTAELPPATALRIGAGKEAPPALRTALPPC